MSRPGVGYTPTGPARWRLVQGTAERSVDLHANIDFGSGFVGPQQLPHIEARYGWSGIGTRKRWLIEYVTAKYALRVLWEWSVLDPGRQYDGEPTELEVWDFRAAHTDEEVSKYEELAQRPAEEPDPKPGLPDLSSPGQRADELLSLVPEIPLAWMPLSKWKPLLIELIKAWRRR